jgi:hypothetical protein
MNQASGGVEVTRDATMGYLPKMGKLIPGRPIFGLL